MYPSIVIPSSLHPPPSQQYIDRTSNSSVHIPTHSFIHHPSNPSTSPSHRLQTVVQGRDPALCSEGYPGPTLGNWLSSSIMASRLQGFDTRSSRVGLLSLKVMLSQTTPCRRYSFCSSSKMFTTKNCWSFSLARLMHSCSKLSPAIKHQPTLKGRHPHTYYCPPAIKHQLTLKGKAPSHLLLLLINVGN